MKKRDLSQVKIWLTGATSGIGLQLAKDLIAIGATLIASGRNEAVLSELRNLGRPGKVYSFAFDISDKAKHFEAVDYIKENLGGVDIVIFNAGDCQYIDVKDFSSDVVESLFKLNFFSMMYGLEAVLPLIRQSEQPQIVAMSSTAAYGGLSRSEAYGASKAAIRNFFESLRIDLVRENIPVSIICPGFVKTPLTDKNDFPMPGMITVDKASDRIMRGIEKYREEIYFPSGFSLILKFLTSLPSSIYTKIMAKTVK